MTLRPLMLAVGAAAALAATPAFADSVRVEYKDLDLATEQGRATLESRLDAAAREACGMREVRTGTRMPSGDARKCYTETRSQIGAKFAGLVDKVNKGG